MKRVVFIFSVSFFLNFIWEHLHAQLYTGHQGGVISEWVLLHATFWDAVIITGVGILSSSVKNFSAKMLFALLLLLIIAVCVEWWALSTGRWSYNDLMPVIPLLYTGLSPTLQLAVTGFLSYFLVFRKL